MYYIDKNSQEKIVVRITNIPQEILTLVYNEPGITVSDICKRLKITSPTAHKAIRILSDKYKLVKVIKSNDSKSLKLYPTLGICDIDNKYLILPIVKKESNGFAVVGFQVIFIGKKRNDICCEEFIKQLPEPTRKQLEELIAIVRDALERLGKDPEAEEIKKEIENLKIE